MSKKLNGKVAVVTGASKGIGAAIAKQLAADGASVVVNYASSQTAADQVVAEITRNGGNAIAVKADVSNTADIERLFTATKNAYGDIDILVNNAGIYTPAPLEEISADQFHKQYDLNVLGLILTTQEAVKHFNTAGGSIVNISSVVSSLGLPGMSATTAPVTNKVLIQCMFGTFTSLNSGRSINDMLNTNGKMADHVTRNCFQRTGVLGFSPTGLNKKSKPLLICTSSLSASRLSIFDSKRFLSCESIQFFRFSWLS